MKVDSSDFTLSCCSRADEKCAFRVPVSARSISGSGGTIDGGVD